MTSPTSALISLSLSVDDVNVLLRELRRGAILAAARGTTTTGVAQRAWLDHGIALNELARKVSRLVAG